MREIDEVLFVLLLSAMYISIHNGIDKLFGGV